MSHGKRSSSLGCFARENELIKLEYLSRARAETLQSSPYFPYHPLKGLSDRLQRAETMLQFSKTSLTMTVVSALVQVCQNAVHWQYRYNNSAFRLSVFDKVIDAQDITASTCAESAEFNACYQRAMSVSLHCTAEAGSDASRIALCGCEVVRAEIACALESCWNVVRGLPPRIWI